MTVLNVPDIPSELFTVTSRHGGSCTMTAEASTIGYRSPHRIYDDACDVGIAIKSRKTGRIVRFYLDHEDDNDGDVAGWWFKPIAEDVRRCPGVRNTQVLIIND